MRGKNFSVLKKLFRMEQRGGGGGEKKCLPRAIYPPPIIKSHRHDPIRRREADGVKILKTYGIMTPYCPPEGLYGVSEGRYGVWGGQDGVISQNDPILSSLTTSLEPNLLYLPK